MMFNLSTFKQSVDPIWDKSTIKIKLAKESQSRFSRNKITDLDFFKQYAYYTSVEFDNGVRADKNVINSADCLIFDIDYKLNLKIVFDRLTKLNLNFILLTSISHTSSNHKFRVILPIKEYSLPNGKIWRGLYKKIMEAVDKELFAGLSDQNCFKLSHSYLTHPNTEIYSKLDGINYILEFNKIKKEYFNETLKEQQIEDRRNKILKAKGYEDSTIENVLKFPRAIEILKSIGPGNRYNNLAILGGYLKSCKCSTIDVENYLRKEYEHLENHDMDSLITLINNS